MWIIGGLTGLLGYIRRDAEFADARMLYEYLIIIFFRLPLSYLKDKDVGDI
jgi:hypothetical protein